MAGLASDMYGKFSAALDSMKETPLTQDAVDALGVNLSERENYADEMRDVLTTFLIECSTRGKHGRRISRLITIIADLENMTDDCCGVCLILERSVSKNQIFKAKEINALIPYVALVSEFLGFIGRNLGSVLSENDAAWAREIENQINESRKKLRKLGRKRIEAGKDVKTELLFIDMVRRIEKLGDYCYNIAKAMSK
jgi:phosphate:Na+ symporter